MRFQNPFTHLKTSWRNLDGLEKWRTLYQFVHEQGVFLQIEIFTKRPNGPILKTIAAMSIFTGILAVYTVCYYGYIGEIVRAIPAFCMLGIIVSTYAVAWNLILGKRMRWVPLIESPGKLFYRNDRQPNAHNRICSECMDDTVKSYIITVTVIILSFMGALIGPAYTHLQDGTMMTLYELRIPFLMEHPNAEFAINMSWQVFISLMAIPGLFGIEGMIALVNNAITVSSKLTINGIEEFSEQLETNGNAEDQSAWRLKSMFRQIIFMDEYIESFRDLYYWRTFLAPPTFLFSISVSIYSQFKLGFPAGYGIAVVSYIQMAVLCVTGQNIINRNDRLIENLYNFKWYLLPAKHQTGVGYMIQHLQSKKGITIRPFEQLNFETLKILSQKVYSLLMFLMNFYA